MKTASLPPIPVDPEFLAEVESVLVEGESLLEFVEGAVRASVERRRLQAGSDHRGLHSRTEARRKGDYVDAEDVVARLQGKLDDARVRLSKPLKSRE